MSSSCSPRSSSPLYCSFIASSASSRLAFESNMGRSSPAPLLPPVTQHLQQVSSAVSGSLSLEPPDEQYMSFFLYPIILVLAAVTLVFSYYLHKTRVRDRRLPVYLPQQDRPAHPTTVPNLDTNTDVREDIPVIVYGDSRSPAEADEKESCAICLDNFEAGEEVGMMPQCSHMFHPACIKKWWLYADCKTCPLCRAVVIAETAAVTEPWETAAAGGAPSACSSPSSDGGPAIHACPLRILGSLLPSMRLQCLQQRIQSM